MARLASCFAACTFFVLLASSTQATEICQCPPTIIAFIDGTNYSNSFLVTTLDQNQGYSITGSISNALFQFSLNVTTQPDPSINVGMSLAGDPTVSIIIIQTFLGGPFPNFFSSSFGTITDANHDGHASLLGSPFIETTFVNGSLVGQQNTGCDLTGPPGFTSPCPTSASQSLLFDSQGVGVTVLPPHGTLEVDIAFTLSDGDAMTLNSSSAIIAAAPVPEPGTGALFGSGLLALALARLGLLCGLGPRTGSTT